MIYFALLLYSFTCTVFLLISRRRNPKFQDYHLVSVSQVQVLQQAYDWIDQFVAQPNASLSRAGTICPFVPTGLVKDTIFFNTVKTNDMGLKEAKTRIENMLLNQLNQYCSERPTNYLSYAYVNVFVDELSEEFKAHIIEEVQRKLKRFFVAKGVMLGEFHDNIVRTSLRPSNNKVNNFQSKAPLLVIRPMVEDDLIVLTPYPEAEKKLYISLYLNYFTKQNLNFKQSTHYAHALKLLNTIQ